MMPLLSICVPTRNRAETLRLTLDNLLAETRPLGDQVEIVVSDNASEDHTPQVLQEYAPWIRSHRREVNVGYFGNLMGLGADLARGRLVWALGDDDLVLPGGVARALRAMTEHPELELFYLNYGWIPAAERDQRITAGATGPAPAAAELHFPLTRSQTLARLEHLALLPTRNAAGIFCGMFCYLLPRRFFTEFRNTLQPLRWDCFSVAADDIYPHAKVLMRAFHGRPVHLVAEPCLLQGVGQSEFSHYSVSFKLIPILQLLDDFATLGLDPAAMAKMWEDFEATAGRNLARLIMDPVTNQGLEAVLPELFPRLAGSHALWDRFHALYQTGPNPEGMARMLQLLTPEQREGLAPATLALLNQATGR